AKRVPRELWVMRSGELTIVTDDDARLMGLRASAVETPKRFDTSGGLFPRGSYELSGGKLRVSQVPDLDVGRPSVEVERFELQCLTTLHRIEGANANASRQELHALLIQQFGPPKTYPPPRLFDRDAEAFVDQRMSRLNGPSEKTEDVDSIVWNVSWLI